MTCKGICVRHRASKPTGAGRYSTGQKRCQICEIFINWNGLWCPCCGYRLRTKPRNLKYKAKLREKMQEVVVVSNNTASVAITTTAGDGDGNDNLGISSSNKDDQDTDTCASSLMKKDIIIKEEVEAIEVKGS